MLQFFFDYDFFLKIKLDTTPNVSTVAMTAKDVYTSTSNPIPKSS